MYCHVSLRVIQIVQCLTELLQFTTSPQSPGHHPSAYGMHCFAEALSRMSRDQHHAACSLKTYFSHLQHAFKVHPNPSPSLLTGDEFPVSSSLNLLKDISVFRNYKKRCRQPSSVCLPWHRFPELLSKCQGVGLCDQAVFVFVGDGSTTVQNDGASCLPSSRACVSCPVLHSGRQFFSFF